MLRPQIFNAALMPLRLILPHWPNCAFSCSHLQCPLPCGKTTPVSWFFPVNQTSCTPPITPVTKFYFPASQCNIPIGQSSPHVGMWVCRHPLVTTTFISHGPHRLTLLLSRTPPLPCLAFPVATPPPTLPRPAVSPWDSQTAGCPSVHCCMLGHLTLLKVGDPSFISEVDGR